MACGCSGQVRNVRSAEYGLGKEMEKDGRCRFGFHIDYLLESGMVGSEGEETHLGKRECRQSDAVVVCYELVSVVLCLDWRCSPPLLSTIHTSSGRPGMFGGIEPREVQDGLLHVRAMQGACPTVCWMHACGRADSYSWSCSMMSLRSEQISNMPSCQLYQVLPESSSDEG